MADLAAHLDHPLIPAVDAPTFGGYPAGMLVRDGFPGQRLRVLPRPLVASALARPVTSRMLVTDCGYFPHAARHGRIRRLGAPEVIVIVCVEGRGRLTVRDEEHAVAPGQAAVIPAETPHLYVADERDPWSIWWLHVAGADVEELTAAATDAGRQMVLPLRDVHAAVGNIDAAVTALEHDETDASLYLASGASWRLLSNLCSDRLQGPAERGDRVRQVQEYIRENLAAPMSLDELAKRSGLSSSHFAALFRKAAGTSVIDYVKRLRSARARELLLTTNRSVTEIAVDVGYADPFYFSRQFRAVNGVSPKAFRLGAEQNHVTRDSIPEPPRASSRGDRPKATGATTSDTSSGHRAEG